MPPAQRASARQPSSSRSARPSRSSFSRCASSAALGPAPELAGRVGVDARHRARPAARGTPSSAASTLRFALAVGDAMSARMRRTAAPDGEPCAGNSVCGSSEAQRSSDARYARHVAIGRLDHHAARAAGQQVATEQRATSRVPERDRVARVAGCLEHVQRPVVQARRERQQSPSFTTTSSVMCAASSRCPDDLRAESLATGRHAAGVVGVVVRDHDHRDTAPLAREMVGECEQVANVARARRCPGPRAPSRVSPIR